MSQITGRYLFRGRRIDNGEWVEGFYSERKPFIDVRAYIQPIAKGQVILLEVDPETVGQWTGILDKNGVKIFEGDFVYSENWNPSTYKVGFDRGAFYLSDQNDKEGVPEIFGAIDVKYADKFEIISNIHDNPELLSK